MNIEIDMLARYVARLAEFENHEGRKKKCSIRKIKARLLIVEARFYADMCDELSQRRHRRS